jgi:eukaryotic-like serine/threonine-protein kinase
MEIPDAAVSQLFEEALTLAPEQRSVFLNEACRGKLEVRRQVEALLEENDRLTGFLRTPAWKPRGGATERTGAAQPSVGTHLGRYLILEQLGAGGMGVVYRARDEKLERVVAIKVLTQGLLTSEGARSHFRREALALARLNHANIAALYDVGEQDGIDYIVMECVQGESLRTVLERGALPVVDATRILVQTTEALEEAHAHGVIHCDLKPGNVMITAKGQAKVLDFGVAKLFATTEATQSLLETGTAIGTPLYMSPEQAQGKKVDARTDLWGLGAIDYEMLTGRPPFKGENAMAVLRAVTSERFTPVRQAQPAVPAEAERIVNRALEKDPARRYQTAAEMRQEAAALLAKMTGSIAGVGQRSTRMLRMVAAGLALILIAGAAAGWWLYRRMAERRWAREEAIPEIESMMEVRRAVPAFSILQRAEKDLAGDAHLAQIARDDTERVTITSEPVGAEVAIQDYLTPQGPVLRLGTTPLTKILIPKGYFRWTVEKAGVAKMLAAPESDSTMQFDLAREKEAPEGMVYAAAGHFSTYNGFIGWVGPYQLPAYYVDRYEVTNAEYQKFVDSGGYGNPKYWPAEFEKDGRTWTWSQGMQQFRDSTGRPGPATWAGGHYPEGKGSDPVSGVSWYEAAAYASYAGKTLPALAQWYEAADFDVSEYAAQLSNLRGTGVAPVGTYQDLGPYGTYDMAGNVREWVANEAESDLRFIVGGSWRSPTYLYTDPEALSPYDRSDANGFRCVRNLGTIPAAAKEPVHRVARDFAKYKPVSDEVFRAYELLYAYPKTPLNAQDDGVVKETEDWREEKVTFDAAYNGERIAAYLFLPKRVKPPYQTILFFPSARVLFLPPDSSNLGDVNFFDYIVQSGRAVMYPVYKDTYERQLTRKLPANPEDNAEPVEWYKDAARSLDYLDTRADIDKDRIGYLGVSMGSADGVIFATLLEDRLKTAILLDGGYFLTRLPPGVDQADYAPRLKIPVLMVNGRYDYTFPPETSQDPLFRMLGTPAADKRHVVLDTPHDVSEDRPVLVKAVLDWLDRYLGRVGE